MFDGVFDATHGGSPHQFRVRVSEEVNTDSADHVPFNRSIRQLHQRAVPETRSQVWVEQSSSFDRCRAVEQ